MPYRTTLQDLAARIANAKHRILEAESELAELQALGQPTRAVEVGLDLMKDTLKSLEDFKRILEGYAEIEQAAKDEKGPAPPARNGPKDQAGP